MESADGTRGGRRATYITVNTFEMMRELEYLRRVGCSNISCT